MVIVLVMHGTPPKNFPSAEKQAFFRLHAQGAEVDGHPRKTQHDALDAKMRAWPRTPENDPFHEASHRLRAALEKAAGCKVLVCFNEFCDPGVDAALDEAAVYDDFIVVVTPMLIRGGSHAEIEIPERIERARQRHPKNIFQYAWPFDAEAVAAFLAEHLREQASGGAAQENDTRAE